MISEVCFVRFVFILASEGADKRREDDEAEKPDDEEGLESSEQRNKPSPMTRCEKIPVMFSAGYVWIGFMRSQRFSCDKSPVSGNKCRMMPHNGFLPLCIGRVTEPTRSLSLEDLSLSKNVIQTITICSIVVVEDIEFEGTVKG